MALPELTAKGGPQDIQPWGLGSAEQAGGAQQTGKKQGTTPVP